MIPLAYVSYASAIFIWTLLTRAPFFVLTTFFLFHAVLYRAVWGTGVVSLEEFLVYYSAVAVLAAVLGYVVAFRLNVRRLVVWLRACDTECGRSWLSVARYGCFMFLFLAPSIPLEMLPNKRWLGGLLSLLVALLVHLMFWACARRDCYLNPEPAGRLTFFVWAFVFDWLIIRFGWTVVWMIWPGFYPHSFWPLYVALGSLAVGLIAVIVMEFGFLRARTCGEPVVDYAPLPCDEAPPPRVVPARRCLRCTPQRMCASCAAAPPLTMR